MKACLVGAVVVAVAVVAFAGGWYLKPVDHYEFRTVFERPAVSNTRTGDLYLWTTKVLFTLISLTPKENGC